MDGPLSTAFADTTELLARLPLPHESAMAPIRIATTSPWLVRLGAELSLLVGRTPLGKLTIRERNPFTQT
jgi:hypothetical protein